jgi:hypothetical protein
MDSNNKGTAFGMYKEFLIVSKEDIEELKNKAVELLRDADNDTSKYYEATAILDTIHYLRERNIYNREFKIKP